MLVGFFRSTCRSLSAGVDSPSGSATRASISLSQATALEHGLTVATRNVIHFRPTGVPILNPFHLRACDFTAAAGRGARPTRLAGACRFSRRCCGDSRAPWRSASRQALAMPSSQRQVAKTSYSSGRPAISRTMALARTPSPSRPIRGLTPNEPANGAILNLATGTATAALTPKHWSQAQLHGSHVTMRRMSFAPNRRRMTDGSASCPAARARPFHLTLRAACLPKNAILQDR